MTAHLSTYRPGGRHKRQAQEALRCDGILYAVNFSTGVTDPVVERLAVSNDVEAVGIAYRLGLVVDVAQGDVLTVDGETYVATVNDSPPYLALESPHDDPALGLTDG